jgi:hypothetical protein
MYVIIQGCPYPFPYYYPFDSREFTISMDRMGGPLEVCKRYRNSQVAGCEDIIRYLFLGILISCAKKDTRRTLSNQGLSGPKIASYDVFISYKISLQFCIIPSDPCRSVTSDESRLLISVNNKFRGP